MRFPSTAVGLGLIGAAALVAACGDLFHGTDWETLCDREPNARGCERDGGTSSSHASSGSGGSGGSVATTSTGGSGGSGGDPCGPYCAEVVNTCVTDAPQYDSQDNCEDVCRRLPHNGALDTNDIACRQRYADKTATDTSFCQAAGPGGGNKCGPICDAYCGLMADRCRSYLTSSSQCSEECKHYDKSVPYSTSVQTGNNLACRLYWVVQAVDDRAKCANAIKESPACVDGDI